MKNIACAFIIFITLSLSYKINAQDKLLSNYDQLSNLQVEKVFLHIDRDILSPGDVLWYKAYLLNDLTYTPATESLNLHIELISNEGKVAANNVSLLQNGLAQGYLKLNDSIPAGNYTLRAYTHQMRNLDDLLFFTQQITILETGSAKQIQNQEPKENMIDLQFMPEGGSLVENVTSKVAFKATDLNGEPYNFQGELYNNKNQLISMVSTMHDGMGFFQLKPIPGESYHVKITSPAIQQKYTLPDALEDGVVVSTNTMSNETIDVYLSANPADFSTKRIKFVLHTRGNVAGMNNIIMNQPVKRLRLPKAQIPAGISCITIMTMTNVPLAERLLYNHRNNDLIVSIKSDKKQYYPREKVNLEIETKDKDGNPVQANLSLSVTDQIGLSKEYQDFPDIYSYFFLNSNFRGTVKNPSYYFKNQDMTKRMHLDLVLMTNGWRNFIWKEVANKDLKLKYKYEKGLDIKGKVIHISKKDVNNKVTLASFDEGFFYQETTTDSLGNFCFRNLLLNDTTNVIIEAFDADNNKLNKIELTQEDYVPAPFKTPNNEKFELTRPESYTKIATEISEYKDQIKTKNHIFLDEVIVRETKHQTVYKPKDNNQRISIIKPSNIIDFDDVLLESTQSIVEVVMARVPGIQKEMVQFTSAEVLKGFKQGQSLLYFSWMGFQLTTILLRTFRNTLCKK